MLKSIRIQNFKSYKDATFELSPFTVLIGANASGKSNAIEALRFMSILAQGQKLSSLPYSTFNKEGGIRGKISNLMYQDSSECSFLCNFDDCDYDNLELTLSLLDEELHISNESVSSSKRKIPLYKIKERSGGVYASDVVVSYDNFTRGSKKNLITNKRHYITESPHPSPFSANSGFFGSRPFSKTNEFLKKNNIKEIEW